MERLSYTISEAMDATGMSKATIWRLIRNGNLKVVRVGRLVLVLAESVQQVLHGDTVSTAHDSHGFNYARYSNACITPWGYCRRLIIKYRPSKKYGDWLMVEARLIRRLKPPKIRRGVREDRRACA